MFSNKDVDSLADALTRKLKRNAGILFLIVGLGSLIFCLFPSLSTRGYGVPGRFGDTIIACVQIAIGLGLIAWHIAGRSKK